MTNHKVGRPSKLTEETIKRLQEARRLGASKKDAAVAAGISESTYMKWQEKANEGGKEYIQFLQLMDGAEVECVLESLKAIGDAKLKDWRAAAWLASHLRPEEYGDKPTKTEHSGEIKITINKVQP